MSSYRSEEPNVAAFTRRQFVTGLGAFFSSQLLLPRVLQGAVLDRGLKPLRLGFLTDCHAMYENNAPASLEHAADLMNSLNPDLIIGGGDFVHGGFVSRAKVMDSRWVLAGSFLKRIRGRLEPLIGNHDFYEPLLTDSSPSGNDPRWRFRKQFGLTNTYRSFEFFGYRFILLDSVRVVGGESPYRGWIDAAQLLWLDRELERIPAGQPIVLCTHIPLKTSLVDSFGAILGPSPGRVRVINAHQVLEKFRRRPLVLVLQGHVHINETLHETGIPFITGGAVCGKWWKGPNMGTYPGLGLIEITPATGSSPGKGSPSDTVLWNYHNTPT
jgi:3',5'-cyclic AMP phosphodiesterase CpdA